MANVNNAEAVSEVSNKLDSEYQTLNNLMADIADGYIDNTTDANKSKGGKVIGKDGAKEYSIGGQKVEIFNANGGPTEGQDVDSKYSSTSPGTMLRISTATSNQSVFTGQLTDTAMKATAMQKAISQKIG